MTNSDTEKQRLEKMIEEAATKYAVTETKSSVQCPACGEENWPVTLGAFQEGAKQFHEIGYQAGLERAIEILKNSSFFEDASIELKSECRKLGILPKGEDQ